jgi:hypothetical protein
MLTRSSFKKPQQAPKRDRSAEFQDFVPKPRPKATACRELDQALHAIDNLRLNARPQVLVPKTPRRKSQAIRDSARDEECTVRITGICNHRTDTTVAAHFPSIDGGRGVGLKAIDEAIAFACCACHDVVDGRTPLPDGATRDSVMLDFFHGHMRTLVRLKQKGLL